MENSGEVVSKDEVIAKLKDEGDFDKLRIKITRKLKDNEGLRENIISIVKQSAALHRLCGENMKPRQVSDAIYEEVGDKVMGQISDVLWQIIRSEDGMKNEITETVLSLCSKLANPKGKEEGGGSSIGEAISVRSQGEDSVLSSAVIVDDGLYGCEPGEPPGFSLNRGHDDQSKGEMQFLMNLKIPSGKEQREKSHKSQDTLTVSDSPPPGFPAGVEQNQPFDGSDEDPDVPPGFG